MSTLLAGDQALRGRATLDLRARRVFAWLEGSLLNPSHALFAEPEYLLAEDPRVGERAIYHSIWEAVSSGATTPTQIGGLVRLHDSPT